jgi:signal transduction histidine kinase
VGQDIQAEFRKVALQEAEARKEIMELHSRQREWTRLLEEQVSDRTAMLQRMADEVKRFQVERAKMLRGISHDLRNPMTVMKTNVSSLADDEVFDRAATVRDVMEAIERINSMLSGLVRTATSDTALMGLSPTQMEIPPLTEKLERRLRALVFARNIRASVFATREAPDSIMMDPLLFDRVIDNLFTNAAKYTERGSIVVELAGTPGFLTVKVSDTGRGIAPEAIEKIFLPGASDIHTRADDSFGLGLSVVVQLLGQVGGRLDVMSKPGVGTTFWAHFPVEFGATEPESGFTLGASEPGALFARVVRIRRAEGA